jgi:hypothetical protein
MFWLQYEDMGQTRQAALLQEAERTRLVRLAREGRRVKNGSRRQKARRWNQAAARLRQVI